jgi:hypothetical protein
MSNALPKPLISTVGNPVFKWYSNWQQEVLTCSRCGWTGTVSVDDLGDPSDCAIIECRQCHRSLGVVVFPNLRDTEEAAAQGNEEATQRLPELLERLRQAEVRTERFEREKIVSVDQLPELDGESLEFIWDLAEVDGDTYQIIRLGDAELWRELAFFDSIPRFNEVKELLRQKYDTRFKALRPTERSEEWLCGDNAGKLFRLSYA